ncbi:JDVT-CTERM system CAAX-type protease [Photobacterium rosenbergii]|uniref:JDVT-CTERM system CAAX-type protease n=1 Tax=Photobacterium rosenbergii TaxID=294936 RepID=A0A2T3NLX8_9GAMM|nr:JDVT-CTERM system glutamic-type intramembrane protease [Photobacterium rosenbergii]PSW16527.1 JDVT-CTERM system CAAX-type protease [Photobacterium rosenbergii]
MSSYQIRVSLKQVLDDRTLLTTICLSVVIGYVFWSLFPCNIITAKHRNTIAWFNILLIYPVLEEVAFRGTIQEELLKLSGLNEVHYGVSKANFITSVLFAGFHIIYQPAWLVSLILLPSLVLGFFKERYATILVPIGLHILFNLVFLLSRLANTCS